MVLYSNVNLNQRVELIYDNQLLRGTVKYKGAVNNLDGEWIGVALDLPCKYTKVTVEVYTGQYCNLNLLNWYCASEQANFALSI